MTDHAVRMSHARRQEFIERLGRLAEGEGLPRIAGRMMGLLMIAGAPLSIDELADQLEVSRASISTNGRLLESLAIAARTTKAGDRRDYLQIGADPSSSLLSQGLRRLHDMRHAVREMRLAARSSRTAQSTRDRLERMERFYDLAIEGAESVLSSWKADAQTPRRRRTPARRAKRS
jgi:DNA-binding transcriptional regulator GbsR (MarR family)